MSSVPTDREVKRPDRATLLARAFEAVRLVSLKPLAAGRGSAAGFPSPSSPHPWVERPPGSYAAPAGLLTPAGFHASPTQPPHAREPPVSRASSYERRVSSRPAADCLPPSN